VDERLTRPSAHRQDGVESVLAAAAAHGDVVEVLLDVLAFSDVDVPQAHVDSLLDQAWTKVAERADEALRRDVASPQEADHTVQDRRPRSLGLHLGFGRHAR